MYHLHTLCIMVALLLQTVLGNYEMVEFENFMLKFNKTYKTKEEYQHRLRVFFKNLKEASRLQREELGTAQYGVTKFSDLTDEEFRSYHLNLNTLVKPPTLRSSTPIETTFPDTWDWRKKGVISEVKNQGTKCRSCWAFATVANIEAQWSIIGYPWNLSVQQVIDCSPDKAGCKGGYTTDAFLTVQLQGGLTSENEYPYNEKKNECKKDLKPKACIHCFEMVENDETISKEQPEGAFRFRGRCTKVMASHIAKKGTLTVLINQVMLQHYNKGIIHNVHMNCDPNVLNHAVLIVGYGGGKHMPFWILKNSWGTGWGENGYFRMFRGKNVCGITSYPLTAVVNKPNGQKPHCPP